MRRAVPLLLGALALAALLWLFLGEGTSLPGYESSEGAGENGSRTTLEGTGVGQDSLTGEPTPGSGGDTGPETPSPTSIRVIGRVVDDSRMPVPGAEVHVALEDRSAVVTTSDENGAWLVDVGAPPSSGFVMGRVRATGNDGRAGFLAISLWPGTADPKRVDAVVLRRAEALPVRVTGAGRPIAGAAVSLIALRFGRVIEVGRAETDAAGLARFADVSPGRYRVFAGAEGHGRAGVVVDLPRESGTSVEVALALERRVGVRVVDGVTGKPVGGAQVYVGDRFSRAAGGVDMVLPPLERPAPTDADGRTELRGLAADVPLQVAAWKAGYARPNPYLGEGRVELGPDQTEITLTLRAHRRIRVPVKAGPVAPPAPGTALRVELQAWMAPYGAEQPRAVMERGAFLLEGMPNIFTVGRVTAPDGTWARFMLLADQQEAQPVSFQRPLSVGVSLRDTRGNPVPGARLRIVAGFAFGPPRRTQTNEEGFAEITGLTQEEGTVYLLAPGAERGGAKLGRFDLRESRRASFVVPDEDVIQLEVQGEEGAQLPPSYTVFVDGMQKPAAEIEELPERGELHVSHRPQDGQEQVRVELQVPGFLTIEKRVSLAETRPVRFNLLPGGSVLVEVLSPADGAFELVLERDVGETTEVWRRVGRTQTMRPDDHGRSRFEGLLPGRYRARDAVSGTTSEVMEVDPRATGSVEAAVLLDLSAQAWVTGQVVGVAGHDLQAARVLKAGEFRTDRPLDLQGASVDGKGRFRIRGTHGKSIELEVRHPILRPADPGGRATVRVGSTGVVLRLDVGNVLHFRIAGESPEGSKRRPRVLFFPPAGGAHVWADMPKANDGRFTVGGFPPGRWRVWIDAYEGVPFSQVVDCTRRAADLGTLRFSAGGTLILRLPGADFAGGATIIATAESTEGPAFQRSAMRARGGDGELRITGLPAGTVQVDVQALGDGKGTGAPTPGSRKTLYTNVITLEPDAQRTIDVRE